MDTFWVVDILVTVKKKKKNLNFTQNKLKHLQYIIFIDELEVLFDNILTTAFFFFFMG